MGVVSERWFQEQIGLAAARSALGDSCRVLTGIVESLKDIPGDIVECGSYRAGSAMAMAAAETYYAPGQPKNVYAFDSFEGLPEPAEQDIEGSLHSHRKTDFGNVDFTEVLDATRYLANLFLVKGYYDETIPKFAPVLLSLIFLDCDLYESHMIALKHLWPMVNKGGVVVFHDYDTVDCPGVKRAIRDFFGEEPSLELFGGFWGIRKGDGCTAELVTEVGMRRVNLMRFGGYGDAIQATPILKRLKEDGYYITLHTQKFLMPIFDGNPNIDKIILHGNEWGRPDGQPDTIDVPRGERVIDLGAIATMSNLGQLPTEPVGCDDHPMTLMLDCPDCTENTLRRRKLYGHIQYFDFFLKMAGYEGGALGELYFYPQEYEWAETITRQWEGRFVVFWSLGSTCYYKLYPWWGNVTKEFCRRHPDVLVYTVGDEKIDAFEILDHPQIVPMCGKWRMRESMLLTQFADLVVGAESGLLNAAGCYDTPKVVLFSHSRPEQLTKHWKNTISLESNAPCHPCHVSQKGLTACPVVWVKSDSPPIESRWPICMAGIGLDAVMNAMEHWYKMRKQWPQ